jgi:integrase
MNVPCGLTFLWSRRALRAICVRFGSKADICNAPTQCPLYPQLRLQCGPRNLIFYILYSLSYLIFNQPCQNLPRRFSKAMFLIAFCTPLLSGDRIPSGSAALQKVLVHSPPELCQLRWSQIDLRHGRLHVNRAKGGIESVHPLHGPELRALRPLQGKSRYVFVTEAGTPVTTSWFLRMVQRTGKAAKLPFPVHPHMLRHSTGYKLANDGHDTRSLAHYLGHRNLQSTARYTALAPDRFVKFWQD